MTEHADLLLPASAFYRALDEVRRCACRVRERRGSAARLRADVAMCPSCRAAARILSDDKPCRWTPSDRRVERLGWATIGGVDRDAALVVEFGLPVLVFGWSGWENARRPAWPDRISLAPGGSDPASSPASMKELGRPHFVPGVHAGVDRAVRACMLDLELRAAALSAVDQGAALAQVLRLVDARAA